MKNLTIALLVLIPHLAYTQSGDCFEIQTRTTNSSYGSSWLEYPREYKTLAQCRAALSKIKTGRSGSLDIQIVKACAPCNTSNKAANSPNNKTRSLMPTSDNFKTKSSIESSSSTEYAIICIENSLGQSVKYLFRWGRGQWESTIIEPYGTSRHWWSYQGNNGISPPFEISFDTDFGNVDLYKTYTLERYRSYSKDCSSAKKYQFALTNRNLIDLFEDPR